MPRPLRVLLVLLAAGVIAGAAAIAAGATSERAPRSSPTAPVCTPPALDTSARLPGTPLLVTPAPNVRDAMPQTQLSFLGAPASRIRRLRVSGSLSGAHSGRIEPYSQGDGGSFVASRPFLAGETVSVSGALASAAGQQPFAYSFTIGSPDPIARLPEQGTPAGPAGSVWHFHSAPDLQPAVLTVTRSSAAAQAGGDIFLSTYPGPGQTGPMIYDPRGRLVYFKRLPANTFATDVRVQRYDGQPVLTWWQGTISRHGFGFGEGEVYSRSYRHLATIHAGDGLAQDLHELTLTPAGTALITAWKPLYCDLEPLGGRARAAVYDSVMQEIDVRTGLVMYEWDSLDHVSLAASYMPVTGASVSWPYDWFHLNSIALEHDGSLLISSRATWAVYDVDPATGTINWTVGGRNPSYSTPPGLQLAWQHDAEPLSPDLFTVFDNGGPPSPLHHSRGLVLHLDPLTHVARVVRSVTIPTPIFAQTQGDLELLPNGDWWIGWGNVNESSEVSASGRQLFEAHTPAGSESYRTLRFPWSAQPRTRPALALSRTGTAGPLRAYASWNGATDVARWRVLGGSSPRTLRPLATIPSSGFETELPVPGAAAVVAVQALGADGRVLASSADVRPPRAGPTVRRAAARSALTVRPQPLRAAAAGADDHRARHPAATGAASARGRAAREG